MIRIALETFACAAVVFLLPWVPVLIAVALGAAE